MKRSTTIFRAAPGQEKCVARQHVWQQGATSFILGGKCRLLSGLSVIALCVFCLSALHGTAVEAQAQNSSEDTASHLTVQSLRLRIVDAAIVSGSTVLLGEIAQPVGNYNQEQWNKLAFTKLWESPAQPNKPVTMSRQRLQQAMAEYFPKLSDDFIYPNTLALQRGGALLLEQDLISLAVKTLTPHLVSLGGEANLHDYRMPPFVFLTHHDQRAEMELPTKLTGGRLNLRFMVKEPDDTVVKKFSGTVFLDYWKETPCATQPLNKEDILDPGRVTFMRKNLAYLREEPWDGKGGHLRIVRPVGTNQVIYQNDVAQVPFIRKGNIVTLLYEGKRFQVSIRGEALADGFPGDNIPIRNSQSNKQIVATIRDQQTVVVK